MSQRFLVKISESYESFAVVEADNPGDAEWLAEELIDSGDIDGVNFKGTLKSGGYDRQVSCMEPTELKVTAVKGKRRKRESDKVHGGVAPEKRHRSTRELDGRRRPVRYKG